jgi:hypothetical protein
VIVTGLFTLALAIATGALVYFARRGLGQLGLTKKDMKTRAERESITSAIKRCDEFRVAVIPPNGELLTALRDHGIPVFVTDASEVQFDPDNKAEVRRAKEWFAALPPDLHNASINIMNRLETWAMYFTHGIADSSVAFGPVGPLYVELVVQLYAVLLVKRSDDECGLFPNLVKLYKIWTGHDVDAEETRDASAKGVAVPKALKQVIELQQKGPIGYVFHPKPRGTDLGDGNQRD